MNGTSTLQRPNGRIGHTKSKNGCLTCKIRRVKCGEEKPFCYRCTSTGRQCEYQVATAYDYRSWSGQSPRESSLLVPIGRHCLNSLDCSLELRAFEYFFERGMPVFLGAMNNRFWKTCVMQACHTEPIIWDAVISLSALFEHPQYSDEPYRGLKGGPNISQRPPVTHQNHRLALLWYNRSLSKLRVRLEQGQGDPSVALISCILYICIELLQDNVTEVLQLYHHGINLISNCSQALLESSISPIFYNFSSLGIVIGYIQPETAFTPTRKMSDRFSSVEEAESAMYATVARCMGQGRVSAKLFQAESIDDELMCALKEEQRTIRTELTRWMQTFETLGITVDGNFPQSDEVSAAKLLLAHAALRVVNYTSTTLAETANDDCIADFEDILKYGRIGITATQYPDGTQPPFSLETSIALPLFICATKCRDYRMRHEALDLLRQAPKVQGLCKSSPYAQMAAKMIDIEEAGLKLSDSSNAKELGMFIPEDRRISNVAVCVRNLPDGRQWWSLKLTKRKPDDEGIWRIVEEVVDF